MVFTGLWKLAPKLNVPLVEISQKSINKLRVCKTGLFLKA